MRTCTFLLKNIKKYKKEYIFLIMNQMLIVLVFSILIFLYHVSLLMNSNDNFGSISFFIFVAVIVAFITSLFFSNISLKNYLKLRNDDYALLITLGIRAREMLKLVIFELFGAILVALVFGLIEGNIAILLLTNYFSYFNEVTNINLMSVKEIVITILILGGQYCISILLSFYNFRKYGIAEAKKRLKRFELPRSNGLIFLIIAVFAQITIIYILWKKYSVLNSLLSLAVMLSCQYFIIMYGGVIIYRIIKRNKIIYLNNILLISRFYYRFDQNKKIIFVIFASNFLILLIVGSIFVSLIDGNDSFDLLFPFETVVFTNNKNNIEFFNNYELENGRKFEIFKLIDGLNSDDGLGEVWGMSESTYQSITNKKLNIKEHESVIIFQKLENQNNPVAVGKRNFNFNGHIDTFSIINAKCQILFGEITDENLDKIVVFNDMDYYNLTTNIDQYTVFINNTELNIDYEKLDLNGRTLILERNMFIRNQNNQNKFLLLTVVLLGILMFTQETGIMYYKIYANKYFLKKDAMFLNELGMENKSIQKLIKNEVCFVLYFPILTSFFWSVYFFLMDLKAQVGINYYDIKNFLFFGIIYLLSEIGYCIILKSLLMSYFKERGKQ